MRFVFILKNVQIWVYCTAIGSKLSRKFPKIYPYDTDFVFNTMSYAIKGFLSGQTKIVHIPGLVENAVVDQIVKSQEIQMSIFPK